MTVAAPLCNMKYYNPVLREVSRCRNGGHLECAACGRTACRHHVRLRCPRGMRTVYGTLQHMGSGQLSELRSAPEIGLDRADVRRSGANGGNAYDAGVVLVYQDRRGGRTEVRSWVGQLIQDHSRSDWTPDGELALWLGDRPPPVRRKPQIRLKPEDWVPLVLEEAQRRYPG